MTAEILCEENDSVIIEEDSVPSCSSTIRAATRSRSDLVESGICEVLEAAKSALALSAETSTTKTSTTLMFESLEKTMEELNLSPDDKEELEDKIWSFVRTEIKYYRYKNSQY